MPRTFFQDFKRDNGDPITVEYSFSSGSETTYSPMYGASGGDPCEVEIISNWPNTQEYNDLHARRQELTLDNYSRQLSPIAISMMSPELREDLDDIDKAIERADAGGQLTDAERERIEAWLCENHVDEPYDDYDF